MVDYQAQRAAEREAEYERCERIISAPGYFIGDDPDAEITLRDYGRIEGNAALDAADEAAYRREHGVPEGVKLDEYQREPAYHEAMYRAEQGIPEGVSLADHARDDREAEAAFRREHGLAKDVELDDAGRTPTDTNDEHKRDDPEYIDLPKIGKVLAWSARRVGPRVADALTAPVAAAGGALADALGGVASDDPAREITANTPITAHTSEAEIAQIDTARAEADRAEAAAAARMRAEILDSYDRDEKAAAAAAERDASLARYDRVDDEHDEPEHEDPARGYSGPERDYSESDALADAQERADTRAVEQECADRIASEAELEAAERDTDDGNACEREVAEADDRLEARANAEYAAHEAAYRAAAGEDERIEEIADPEIEGPELDDDLGPEL